MSDLAGEMIAPTAILNLSVSRGNEARPSPDGRKLVVSGGTSLYLIDARTRAVLRVFRGHQTTINAVDISRDGRYLASGGQDRALRLWDLSSPSDDPIAELGDHARPVYGVRFSPDGHYLASASADGKLRLWRAPPHPPGPARLIESSYSVIQNPGPY